jgi:hypothetical protein
VLSTCLSTKWLVLIKFRGNFDNPLRRVSSIAKKSNAVGEVDEKHLRCRVLLLSGPVIILYIPNRTVVDMDTGTRGFDIMEWNRFQQCNGDSVQVS